MPLTPQEIDKIGKTTIDYYRRNKPKDQINVERPLLDILLPRAKPIVGGKEFISENIFVSNGANGQYWAGNSKVTYNTRNPNELAKYSWANFHDGFTINEDELTRNGIKVVDDKGKTTATRSEVVQLTNMLESQFKALDEGAKDFIHAALWLDGTQAADARPGIDALVSTTPAVGVVGGISAVTNTYWRNYVQTGITGADAGARLAAALDAMEKAKRSIMRTKGRVSNIFVGGDFLDFVRNAAIAANTTQFTYQGGSKISIDMATNNISFDGVPLTWVPDFDTNFGGAAPTIPWSKRCYMLDLRSLWLNRDEDDWMRIRYPGRPIDQYVYYFAETAKFGLSMDKRNSHAVLSIA
jgi:hypothetical protein